MKKAKKSKTNRKSIFSLVMFVVVVVLVVLISKKIVSDFTLNVEHSFDSGNIIVASTCETNGIKRYTCTECGYYYEEELDTISHDYSVVVSEVSATCQQEGLLVTKCIVCNKTKTETFEKTEHSIVSANQAELIYEAQNCQETNVYRHRCLFDCGYYIDKNVGVGDCSYEYTILDDTYHTAKCALCGDEFNVNHIYDVEKFDENNSWIECICGHIDNDTLTEHNIVTTSDFNGELIYEAQNCSEMNIYRNECTNGCGFYIDTEVASDIECSYVYESISDTQCVQKCQVCEDIVETFDHVLGGTTRYEAQNCQERSYSQSYCGICQYVNIVYGAYGDCIYTKQSDDSDIYTCVYCEYETEDTEEVYKITFTCSNSSALNENFVCEYGMTWEEFIASDYCTNKDNFTIDDTSVYYSNNSISIGNSSDIIEPITYGS